MAPLARGRPAYGFFGGSFDPVHNGHLALARAALGQRRLAKVFFVPTNHSPRKARLMTSSADRIGMLKLALGRQRRLAVARWDLERRGRTYTVNTMARLRRRFPGRRWEIIAGGDSLRDFKKWRRWRMLLKNHVLVVGPRPGVASKSPRGWKDRVVILKGNFPMTSATAIRRRAARALSLRGLVPPKVGAYIRRKGLYRV